mgnify:CR=1
MLKSTIPSGEKLQILYMMDEVLGFGLKTYREQELKRKPQQIPTEVKELVQEREMLRKSRQFGQADQIRNKILKMGYEVVDTKDGFEIREI